MEGGNVVIAGRSEGNEFPLASPYQNRVEGDWDGFVTVVSLGGLIVNSDGDSADSDLTDGLCDRGNEVMMNGIEVPECTLRAALQEANVSAGRDSIRFAIPVAGNAIPVIRPGSALPEIRHPVSVVGTSQASGRVTINGSGAAGSVAIVHGLRISGGGSVFKGRTINNFSGHGLLIRMGGDNEFEACYFGTSADERFAGVGNDGDAIRIESSANNLIRNCVIAAAGREAPGGVLPNNGGNGIVIAGVPSSGYRVVQNKIGIDQTGTLSADPSGAGFGVVNSGVVIRGAPENLIGGRSIEEGNIIANSL